MSEPFELETLFKNHRHKYPDSQPIEAGDLEGILPMNKGGTGTSLVDPDADRILFWDDSAGAFTWLSLGTGLSISGTTLNGTADPTLVTVTAGEAITAGEIVRLYVAGSDASTRGYNQTTNTVYCMRAAANDTTYGDHIIGMAYENINYLSTGRVHVAGWFSGLSGLTGASKYYLANYSGASSITISQTQEDADFSLGTGNTLQQIWVPTSSRLDKVVLKGYGDGTWTVKVFRHSTELATANVTPSGVGFGWAGGVNGELTFDFGDVRTYKGELLRFVLTCANSDFNSLRYKSGGDVYAPSYAGDSGAGYDLTKTAGTGTIAAASDLYMKVYEYTSFGTLSTSAGTRKIKVGQALSATTLAYAPQLVDSIL